MASSRLKLGAWRLFRAAWFGTILALVWYGGARLGIGQHGVEVPAGIAAATGYWAGHRDGHGE